MRLHLLAAAAATTALLAPPAAHAAGAVELNCIVTNGRGVANCTAAGVVGTTIVSGPVQLNYTAVASCPTSFANGSATGVVNFVFSWSAVGPVGLVSTSGDVSGNGIVTFSTACPTAASTPFVMVIAGL